MSLRFAKQLVYGAFYVILACAIVFGVNKIWNHATPSCFDHVQDQGEQGVDCGGPCATVCVGSVAPPIITSVNAFPAANGHETFLAKIVNPNSDYAADSFDYLFNVYSASNAVLASFPGHASLYPGEVKYILLPNQLVPAGVANADLTLANAHWVAAASYGLPVAISIQNVATQIGSSTIVVTGQAVNQDVAPTANVTIIAIVKDGHGTPLGASQTLIDSISPGQSENFSVSYPATSGVDPTATEVVAYPAR